MTLAADKLAKGTRIISSNALVGARVLPSGFSNVLMEDAMALASGGRIDRLVFFGETAPGTNYDTVGNVGDEYWQYTLSSGAVTVFAKYKFIAGTFHRAADADAVYCTNVTLTSAQVKALKATPIELVPAPGADFAIVPVAINMVCNYGGTNAFTEAADDFSIEYVGSSTEIKEIEATGFIDQAVDEWRYITFEHAETFIPVENEAVGITNLDDEFAGNAGADNTVAIKLYYRIVPTDA